MTSVPGRWSLSVGLGWLIALVGTAWYLGHLAGDEEAHGIPAAVWLVIGVFLALSFALGAVLMADHRRWVLVVTAWLVGSLVAPIVFLVSVFGLHDLELGYYPVLWLFAEFAVVLLVPLAIGAALGRLIGGTHLVGLLITGVAAIALTDGVIALGFVDRHSTEAAEQQLSDIAAHSSTPVYYVGPRFHGLDLNEPTMFSNNSGRENPNDRSFDPGDELYVGYGSACSGDTCGDEFEIQMRRGPLRLPADCVMWVPGPRGTVLVRERFGSWDAVTGDQTLRVETTNRDHMVELVNSLRPVGDRAAHPAHDLPAPSADARRRIRNACRKSS